uniref:Putative secreted peptide n=1 Tax=Anopheles braziliensis TaxID=58242 RepID=A0A2M3ZSA4_9DIPT
MFASKQSFSILGCTFVSLFMALIVEGALGRTSCTRSYEDRSYGERMDTYGSKIINSNNGTLTIFGQ